MARDKTIKRNDSNYEKDFKVNPHSYEGFYDLNTIQFVEDQTKSNLNLVYNEFIKRAGFAVKCDVKFINGKIKMLKLLQ